MFLLRALALQMWILSELVVRRVLCALTVDDGRCAAEEGRLEAIVETPDGIAERGRCGVRCVADDTASSFVPMAAYSTAVSNLTAFKTEAYPGVRLAAQPFVIAGDVFLAESGDEVVVTRVSYHGIEITCDIYPLQTDTNAPEITRD